MKVSELIEQLKTLDQDALVVTKGYEGGYEDVTGGYELFLELNVNTEWYYGPHMEVDERQEGKAVKAYVL